MIKRFFSSELGQGSLVLFIMINFYNFFNYLFHFLTARLLGPADYGTLAVLMSIVYIFAIPSEAIQTIVSRYTSAFNVRKELGKMHFLLSKVLRKGLRISLICFVFFSLFSIFLSRLLSINYFLFFITGGVVFGIFLLPAVRGILQGRKRFKALGTNMIIESSSKIVFALLLIGFGFRVSGAITGVVFGIFISFFLSFFFIREVLRTPSIEAKIDGVYGYSFSVFLAILTVILLYSLDIILAKFFFPADVAGKYAVASMIGKMIFFGTYPISKAMFPLSSEDSDAGKKTRPLFITSFFLLLVLCAIPLLIMLFYPKILVLVLFGNSYLEIAPVLFFLGSAMSILSFANLIIMYGISVKKLSFPFLLFLGVIFEVLLFSFFHSNLREFSLAFLFSAMVFLGLSFLSIRRKG